MLHLHTHTTLPVSAGVVGEDYASKLYHRNVRQLESIIPSNAMVAAAGDIMHHAGSSFLHRCSAMPGTSGGGVRILHQPQALAGIHFAGVGEIQVLLLAIWRYGPTGLIVMGSRLEQVLCRQQGELPLSRRCIAIYHNVECRICEGSEVRCSRSTGSRVLAMG